MNKLLIGSLLAVALVATNTAQADTEDALLGGLFGVALGVAITDRHDHHHKRVHYVPRRSVRHYYHYAPPRHVYRHRYHHPRGHAYGYKRKHHRRHHRYAHRYDRRDHDRFDHRGHDRDRRHRRGRHD